MPIVGAVGAYTSSGVKVMDKLPATPARDIVELE